MAAHSNSNHNPNHINLIALQSVDVEALFQEVFKGGKTEEDFLATIDALEAWCVPSFARMPPCCKRSIDCRLVPIDPIHLPTGSSPT